MNKTVLVGRLTKDVELRKTTEGKSVTNFIVAINRTYTNANGEREADFINCVAWGGTADNMATYVSKGSLVGVDGRIQTRSYEAEGRRVYVTEVFADSVQFLDPKETNQPAQQSNDFFADFNPNANQGQSATDDIDEMELPF